MSGGPEGVGSENDDKAVRAGQIAVAKIRWDQVKIGHWPFCSKSALRISSHAVISKIIWSAPLEFFDAWLAALLSKEGREYGPTTEGLVELNCSIALSLEAAYKRLSLQSINNQSLDG